MISTSAVSRSRVLTRDRTALAVPAMCLVFLGLTGCRDDVWVLNGVSPPPIIWEGEHIRVGTDLDVTQWCPGNLEWLDGYVASLDRVFRTPSDPDPMITYYLFDPPLSDIGVCGNSSQFACTYQYLDTNKGAVIATPYLPHQHEVVHAVAAKVRSMPPFFSEGAASYWGDAITRGGSGFHGLDIRDVLHEKWDGGLSIGAGEYALAADFTSYLTHVYGLAEYVDLLHRTNSSQSRDEFEAVFSSAMGSSLDEAIDDYQQDWKSCGKLALRSPSHVCEQEPVPVRHGMDAPIDIDLSCANLDVLGPRPDENGESRIWHDFAVEFQEDGPYDVWFDHPSLGESNSVRMELRPCQQPCIPEGPDGWVLEPVGTPQDPYWFTVPFHVGEWAVHVSRRADEPGPVTFRFE